MLGDLGLGVALEHRREHHQQRALHLLGGGEHLGLARRPLVAPLRLLKLLEPLRHLVALARPLGQSELEPLAQRAAAVAVPLLRVLARAPRQLEREQPLEHRHDRLARVLIGQDHLVLVARPLHKLGERLHRLREQRELQRELLEVGGRVRVPCDQLEAVDVALARLLPEDARVDVRADEEGREGGGVADVGDRERHRVEHVAEEGDDLADEVDVLRRGLQVHVLLDAVVVPFTHHL